jgi:RNA polymerase sigma factor (TIGR02999 family)
MISSGVENDAGDEPGPPGEITAWLHDAARGDAAAQDRLYRAVYADLRRLAVRVLRSSDAARPTSLVHEAYVRLARPGGMELADRQHFFAVAARAMRQLVVDRARARGRTKRGGGEVVVALDEERIAADAGELGPVDALAIDRALARLAAVDAWLGELVELRFFGGLSLEEIAELRPRSERSLKRDWRKARALLHVMLGEGGGPADGE